MNRLISKLQSFISQQNTVSELRKIHLALRQSEIARLAENESRYAKSLRLNRYEGQVFSQNGEDGILQEIFRRIDKVERTFVEFGVGDGLENNTALLLLQGWKGLWIEGSGENIAAIHRNAAPYISGGALKVEHAMITAENIDELIGRAGFPRRIGLLSIDIDGNDYWVWKRIQTVKADVVVLEYNAMFPSSVEWVMPYNPQHLYRSDMWFGASLAAYFKLGTSLGYTPVACNLSGCNVFFVLDEHAHLFPQLQTPEELYEPYRPHLGGRIGKARRLF